MFTPGQHYKRSTIHDQYGGSRQNGISPSRKIPVIFMFTGAGGKQHGYKDLWLNDNVFSYTGEGQVGDMRFIRGNLALRDHLTSGKQVFLFKYVRKGIVEFVSEMEVFDFGLFETHDRNNENRSGIKFFLKRKGVALYSIPEELRPFAADSKKAYGEVKPNVTERSGLVTSRVGQGAYRKSILHRWEYKCAVTEYNDPRLLIASHIVPWKDSSDDERLDVDNGILLSPTYDALFDRHLISFENSGKIILSDDLGNFDTQKIKITGKERIIGLSTGNMEYLEKHRSQLL